MSKTLMGIGPREDTFNVEKKGNTILIKGHIWCKNALFEYSLQRQESGDAVYKGSVRAIGLTGKTLKKKGNARKKIIVLRGRTIL